MTQQQYPRSPKALLGGIAHLGRFIDKIKLRNAGQIQDYNYVTAGFDKYLVDFLGGRKMYRESYCDEKKCSSLFCGCVTSPDERGRAKVWPSRWPDKMGFIRRIDFSCMSQ